MATLGILNSQGAHGIPLSLGIQKPACCKLRTCHLWSGGGPISRRIASFPERHRRRCPRLCTGFSSGKGIRPIATTAKDGDTSEGQRADQASARAEKRSLGWRKITDLVEKSTGFRWLIGPAVVTAGIVIPSIALNLVSLFKKNFLGGLAATFGLDILFVISADLFLVLADKFGHHQHVSGGPPPWIGPWEYTGYPAGYPKLLNTASYVSVGMAILAIVAALLTANFPAALVTFGPYLFLIFAQVAYERLVGNERLPVFPLVPIIYTVYRFRQLNRGLALLPSITGKTAMLSTFVHVSSVLWALYLGMYLTQLPWLYSTWNSNRST